MNNETTLIKIDAYKDCVDIIVNDKSNIIDRPSTISVSQWLEYWEAAAKAQKAHGYRRMS